MQPSRNQPDNDDNPAHGIEDPGLGLEDVGRHGVLMACAKAPKLSRGVGVWPRGLGLVAASIALGARVGWMERVGGICAVDDGLVNQCLRCKTQALGQACVMCRAACEVSMQSALLLDMGFRAKVRKQVAGCSRKVAGEVSLWGQGSGLVALEIWGVGAVC
jgi:hypothetical protein